MILYTLIALTSGVLIGSFLKPSNWKSLPNWLFVCSLLFVLIVATQFIRASGGPSWNIAPEYWAQFGAFVGGILLAATLVYQFYTFKKQKEQSELQFRKTQLQSRFYEMIKYHRENVLEFKHVLPDKEKQTTVEGRKVFVEIYKQFLELHEFVSDKNRLARHNIHSVSKLFSGTDSETISQIRKQIGASEDHQGDIKVTKFAWIDISYHILFFGLAGERERSALLTLNRYNHEFLDEIFDELENKNASYDKRDKGFIKYNGGHLHRLGHYYRHLFQTVKLIDQTEDLTYEEKYAYVKNLRAQLSTYEQIMLYIDSISGLGNQWEFGDEKNYFITKYNLIQNIPVRMLPFEIIPTLFYGFVPFEDLDWGKDQQNTRKQFLKRIMPGEDLSFLDK
ncbi:putative phage abortive infection protein [Mangrovibacterium marinum]|uniref:putative phage abortive infection protein n=1 Tax=Mangrovibacterium marinum TaxID=1639118 RepID=UPI002A189372|nr:putative phage abortive infection protein [Mangrovibacterium marinum]